MIDSLIVIVGRPGSGKTTAAKALADQLGCLCLSMGAIIRRHAARSAEQRARYLRPEPYSGDELSEMLVPFLANGHDRVVLDGSMMLDRALDLVRRRIQIRQILTVVLECDTETRWQRLRPAARKGREQEDIQFFAARERAFDEHFARTIQGLSQLSPVVYIDGSASRAAVLHAILDSLPPDP